MNYIARQAVQQMSAWSTFDLMDRVCYTTLTNRPVSKDVIRRHDDHHRQPDA